MRRMLVLGLVWGLFAALGATAALGAEPPSRLTAVPGTHFPDRSYVLTLQTPQRLNPSQVLLRENRRRVSRFSITPAHSVGKADFGVVLLVDASKSMRGRAIRDALAAAQAFAGKRNPQQQLAVVTFNREAVVAVPLTTDGEQIKAALTTPPTLGDGTHVYDAVAKAIGLLQGAKIRAGSIVLLSDGSDTGSQASKEDVAAAAEAAGVRLFSVGLRSPSFDRAALDSLAAAGHGDYSEAGSSGDLPAIYDALGTKLASEYLIRYRSLASLGAKVHVELSAFGIPGAATNDYLAPPEREKAPKASLRHASGFWNSSLVMLAVSFMSAFLIGVAVVAMLWVRPRENPLQRRMEGFVTAAPQEDEPRPTPTFTDRMLVSAEKSLERMRWWPKFKEELEIARMDVSAVRVVVFTAIATVFLMWLLLVLFGTLLVALVALAVPFGVRAFIKLKLDRQRKLFAEQLADNLQVIASAMRAGHSFVGALSVAVEDAPEPARGEFRRVTADEKLGVPLEDALGVVARRMASHDLEQVLLVAVLQRRTGGNTAEVIDRVSENIRERAELRRMVETLTAQGRLSRWIVSILPVALLLIISAMNPTYVSPLYHTATGHVLLVLGACMVITGSLVIKRIVDIEV
jgi:tight adherence protein B